MMATARTRRLRRLSILTVLTLLAGCLVSVAVTALTGIPAARADTVPPPPPGDHGVRRQFRRPGRVRAVGGELVLRHRHRLRHRRDRTDHQLDQ